MVGGVQGGASRRPSTNQRATSEVAAAQPIRPRYGEKGGPRDVTTPPGQLTDLPLVLAIGEGEERFCVPKPSSEGERRARRRPLPTWTRVNKVAARSDQDESFGCRLECGEKQSAPRLFERVLWLSAHLVAGVIWLSVRWRRNLIHLVQGGRERLFPPRFPSLDGF